MEEHLKKHEGQLLKFTNVMKGWLNRWFVLDPWTGMLDYFLSQQETNQRPRGSIHLGGASVMPSEEESAAFSIIPSSGETYRLKASDTRERQLWVDRLRAVVELQTPKSDGCIPVREHMHHPSGGMLPVGGSAKPSPPLRPPEEALTCTMSVPDALASVREFIQRTQMDYMNLVASVESLPSSGELGRNARDILLFKAISQSTLLCLEQCFNLLQAQAKKSGRKRRTLPRSTPPRTYPAIPDPAIAIRQSNFYFESPPVASEDGTHASC